MSLVYFLKYIPESYVEVFNVYVYSVFIVYESSKCISVHSILCLPIVCMYNVWYMELTDYIIYIFIYKYALSFLDTSYLVRLQGFKSNTRDKSYTGLSRKVGTSAKTKNFSNHEILTDFWSLPNLWFLAKFINNFATVNPIRWQYWVNIAVSLVFLFLLMSSQLYSWLLMSSRLYSWSLMSSQLYSWSLMSSRLYSWSLMSSRLYRWSLMSSQL